MKKQLSAVAQQTKENIIQAFWKLYLQKRINKITVSEICSLSGYNRSTFYVYFEDVYDVLNEIEEKVITPSSFRQLILSIFTSMQTQEDIFNHILTLFEENSTYLPVLLGEHGDPEFRNKLLKKLRPIVIECLNISPTAMNSTLPYLMEYQSAAVFATISKWYQNGKDISKDELIQLLIDLTTKGFYSQVTSL